jgi:RNA recognition motif-containing protein
MSVRLFVGNLPYDTTEMDLRELFSPIGLPSTVIIPTDRETGKPRGFAFVEFDDPAHAEEASRQLNQKLFKGRTIAINAGWETRVPYETLRCRSQGSPRPYKEAFNGQWRF